MTAARFLVLNNGWNHNKKRIKLMMKLYLEWNPNSLPRSCVNHPCWALLPHPSLAVHLFAYQAITIGLVLFLEYSRLFPASGLLHMLSLLLRMIYSTLFSWLALSPALALCWKSLVQKGIPSPTLSEAVARLLQIFSVSAFEVFITFS